VFIVRTPRFYRLPCTLFLAVQYADGSGPVSLDGTVKSISSVALNPNVGLYSWQKWPEFRQRKGRTLSFWQRVHLLPLQADLLRSHL